MTSAAFRATATAISVEPDRRFADGGRETLRIFESDKPLPLVSSINYAAGQTRANDAVVPLSEKGWFSIFCEQVGGTVDVIVDVNGFLE